MLTVGRTNRLFAAARLILRDDGLAEDVVQETLISAWQDLRGLREPDRFDAWLHRILVRTCYRSAARARRRAAFEVAAADDSRPDDVDTPATVANRDVLERGFERLSPDQRAVIVLHHSLGYTLAESADILGVPLGTVQSRLHRALLAMRAGIDGDDRPPAFVGRPG